MGIDLIELETFIAVAQAESFSAAALRMHVTQPTVTGRIQRLETALGAKLLRRTTRKVETTPQGAVLLAEAIKALDSLGRLVHGFRKKATQARQRVVVAATPTLAALTLPLVIHGYSERFPDVDVELRDLQYADVLAAIDDGSAGLGVLAFEGEDARYRFQSLWSDDMLLMAPRNHPLATSESALKNSPDTP
jgi:LysR family carnitine catabolism transcriptional activator